MSTKTFKIFDFIIEVGWLLIFFLVPLIFLPSIYSVVHIAEYVVFQILVEVIVFAWVLKIIFGVFENQRNRVSNWKLGFQNGRYVLPAFIFIVILGIAAIFSQSPHMSFWGYYFRKMGYIMWLHFFAFFLVLFFNLKNKKQIIHIFYTIVITTTIAALYGFVQMSGFDIFFWAEPAHRTYRIFSTLGQPNFFASWLLLAIPIIIGVLLLSLRDRRSKQSPTMRLLRRSFRSILAMTKGNVSLNPRNDKINFDLGRNDTNFFKLYFFRPFLVTLLFFSILALVFTQSRGGWISFFLGFFFFAIIFSYIKQQKRIAVFLCFFLVFAIGTLVYFNFYPLDFSPDDSYLERRVKTLTQLSSAGERRLITWRNSIDLIRQKPLIGYGPEVQKLNFIRYYTPASAALEAINTYPDRAHNDILDTLLISGALGLISYLFFICVIFWFGLKYIFKNYRDPTSIVVLSLLTGVFAYLISLQFSFHVIPTAVYFWAYVAIVLKIVISTNAFKY